MGVITFNGAQSAGIFEVEYPPAYEMAEKKYDIIPVPGRNGDLVVDTGGYNNTTRDYQISFGSINGNHTELARKVGEWLHSGAGYLRLEDTYEPDYFKLAFYSGTPELVNILTKAGRGTITFERKPERFLKSGETIIVITTTKTIVNPTKFISSPLIRVNGTGKGAVNIGDYRIEIENISNWLYIDSDLEDAYKNTTNMNVQVTCINGFPRLKPGDNIVTFEGGVTGLQITPRWWTI